MYVYDTYISLSMLTNTTRRWWQCDKQGFDCMYGYESIQTCLFMSITNPCKALGIHGTLLFKNIHHLCRRAWCNATYACRHWAYLWCNGMFLWLSYKHSKAWLKELWANQMLIPIAYENSFSTSTRREVQFLVLNMFWWQLFKQDVDDKESF